MPYLLALCIGVLFSMHGWSSPAVADLGEIPAESIRYVALSDTDLTEHFDDLERFDWRSIDPLTLNPRHHDIWLRFDLQVSAGEADSLVMTNQDFFTRDVTLYVVRRGEVIQQTTFGNSQPIEQRPIPYTFPVVPLDLESGGEYTLLIHTRDRVPRLVLDRLTVMPERELAFVEIPGALVKRAMLTGVLVLLLALILLLLVVRYRRDFLYASIFLFSSIGTIMIWDGMLYPLFGLDQRWWYEQGISMLLFFGLGAVLVYLEYRLPLRRRWLKYYVIASALSMFLIAAVVTFQELYTFEPVAFITYAVYANALVPLAILGAISVWRGWHGDWRARIFAAVWSLFIVMATCRFVRGIYPDFELGTSRQWSFSLALTAVWLVIEYFLEVAREEFGKRRHQLAAESRIEMVNRLSHEIRTPLNAVIGLADLLRTQQRDTAVTEKYAGMIHDAGQTLLGLVNDILDFSKLGAGRPDLERAPFRLDASIANTMSHFLQPIAEKRIVATGYIEPHLNVYLLGDELRLKQILFNLVNNAIKFTPENGNIDLVIQRGQSESGREHLLFEIADSGRGIPEGKLDSVFEPYSQSEIGDSSRLKGVGLGLAITKLLVESMGGSIRVDSEPGRGCRFHFDLWLETNPAAPDLSVIFEPLRGKRIAFICGMGVYSKQYQDTFAYYGVDFVVYPSKEAFIDAAGPYDLVILESYISFKPADVPLLTSVLADYPVLILDSRVEAWPESLGRDDVVFVVMPITALGLMAVATEMVTGEPVTLPDEREPDAPVHNLAHHRVLVADDNALNLMVCGKLLESLNVDYVTADGGEQALAAVKAGDFSLVLLDCEMPDVDGYIVARAIRQWERGEGRPPLPVVALTAHTVDEVQQRCLDEGMNEVVHKPISRRELAALLNRY